MHIPDGLLDIQTCLVTGAVAAVGVGYSTRRVSRTLAGRATPLMGVTAACVFAAQMVNFPVLAGVSGHLMGGVLAAALVGPWGGTLVLAVVLFMQMLLFRDGGLTALGANVLNVGMIGPVIGYAIMAPLRRRVGGPAGVVAGSVLAAWFTVVLGAIACSVEVAASGKLGLGLASILGPMLLVHSVIGLGEAIITGVALSFVVRTRPDLIYDGGRGPGLVMRSGQVVVAGLAVALVVAVLVSPFASELPDGLDWVSQRLGIEVDGAAWFPAPFPDYKVSGLARLGFFGSAAGAIGTLAVFALAFLLSRGLRSGPLGDRSIHAS